MPLGGHAPLLDWAGFLWPLAIALAVLLASALGAVLIGRLVSTPRATP